MRGSSDDLVRAVVEHDDPTVGEPSGRGLGPSEHGALRAQLGLECRGRQRGRLDDAGVGRAAGRRVEQVVRRAGVVVEPAAPADAAGGDRAVADLETCARAARAARGDMPTMLGLAAQEALGAT
jgi:hypothetical protein